MACLGIVCALAPALLAPEGVLRGFVAGAWRVLAGAGEHEMGAAFAPQMIDRIAALSTGDVLLHLQGFAPDDARAELVYYRSVYAMWPRRVLLGPARPVLNNSRDITAAVASAGVDELPRHGVSHVAWFQPAADGGISARIAPARQAAE